MDRPVPAGGTSPPPTSRVPAYARMLQGALKALVHWRIAEGGSLAQDSDLTTDLFLRGMSA